MGDKPFFVRFWGVRGAMASCSSETMKYGSNTACVEMRCGDETLIFDAGSGFRLLGDALMKRGCKHMNLLFTHCHYDHISGLPFFAPFFDPDSSIDIWSGHLAGPDKTMRMMQDYMQPPFFPVGPEVFSASITTHDFEPEDTLRPVKGVTIKTCMLDHHDDCIGYRIEFDGRVICYITDTTHIPGKPDKTILRMIRNADLVIYDATYTDAEFPQFWNFGHSTWEEGARLCAAANVKHYCPFHHRPSRTDAQMDVLAREARKLFKKTSFAREGKTIRV